MAKKHASVTHDDIQKLLDNGWSVLLFRNELGSYTAVACKPGQTMEEAIDDDRYLTDDFLPSSVLHRLAGKVTQSGEYSKPR